MTTASRPDHAPGVSASGPARGLVWSLVLAEMRAEARAAGDDRFDRPHRPESGAAAGPHLHAVPAAGARAARPAGERRDGGRSAA